MQPPRCAPGHRESGPRQLLARKPAKLGGMPSRTLCSCGLRQSGFRELGGWQSLAISWAVDCFGASGAFWAQLVKDLGVSDRKQHSQNSASGCYLLLWQGCFKKQSMLIAQMVFTPRDGKKEPASLKQGFCVRRAFVTEGLQGNDVAGHGHLGFKSVIFQIGSCGLASQTDSAGQVLFN